MGSVFSGPPSAPSFNQNAALASQAQNMHMNQYGLSSPFGSINWTGNALDGTRQMEVTLSPFEQARLDSAFGMLPTLNASHGQEAGERAAQAAFDMFRSQNTAVAKQEMENLGAQLANQGIPVGSRAHNDAMKNLARRQNQKTLDAQNQAVLTGNKVQTQQLNNALNLFNTLQNVNNPVNSYIAGIGAQNQDIYGQSHRAQMDAFKQQSANQNSQFGNFKGMASLALPFLSDARLKENVMPVGKLFNGLTVYLFTFKGEEMPQIGLLAQEVKQYIPDAVIETGTGALAVNYELAVKEKES